jgi:hypothetical protein
MKTIKDKVPERWVKMEMEHTNSKKKARKIVQDHLDEHGMAYYPALIKMEAKLKKRK